MGSNQPAIVDKKTINVIPKLPGQFANRLSSQCGRAARRGGKREIQRSGAGSACTEASLRFSGLICLTGFTMPS
jgi:hypothetical protein